MAFTSHTGQPGTGYFWNVGLNSCQCPQHPCWQGWSDPIFCLVTSLLKERSYRQSQATTGEKWWGLGLLDLRGPVPSGLGYHLISQHPLPFSHLKGCPQILGSQSAYHF